MPVACYDLLRNPCEEKEVQASFWGPIGLHSGHFSNYLDKDREAGRNTLLAYYPKYPLLCEICAVAICDRGFSEERTLPRIKKGGFHDPPYRRGLWCSLPVW